MMSLSYALSHVARKAFQSRCCGVGEVGSVCYTGFISPLHRQVCKQLESKAWSAPEPLASSYK